MEKELAPAPGEMNELSSKWDEPDWVFARLMSGFVVWSAARATGMPDQWSEAVEILWTSRNLRRLVNEKPADGADELLGRLTDMEGKMEEYLRDYPLDLDELAVTHWTKLLADEG